MSAYLSNLGRKGPLPEIKRARGRSTSRRQELFCGNSFLEEFDLAARVVGDRKNFVKLDLRVHAVALHDAVEPWPTIECLDRFG